MNPTQFRFPRPLRKKRPPFDLLVLLCSLFFLSGCSEKDEVSSTDVSDSAVDKETVKLDLEGQVFIATRGGENVKLGLVKVYIIPNDTRKKIASNKIVQNYFSDLYKMLDENRGSGVVADFAKNLVSGSLRKSMPEFLDKFTPPVMSHTTDADGEFKCSLEAGPYWVYASGERSVPGSDKEFYVWLTRLDVGEDGQRIILSNDTLVSSFTNFYNKFTSPGN